MTSAHHRGSVEDAVRRIVVEGQTFRTQPKVRRWVSERLGHATTAFTSDVYTHAIPKLQEEAANRVADLIAGASSDQS